MNVLNAQMICFQLQMEPVPHAQLVQRLLIKEYALILLNHAWKDKED